MAWGREVALVRLGQAALEGKLAAAFGEQLFQKRRMLVADHLAQAGEEGVAVAQVADAAPGPVCERLFRAAGGRRGSRSRTTTSRPVGESAMAVQRPAMPAPMTTTFSVTLHLIPRRGSLIDRPGGRKALPG
jgi:hypothetical protein